jgi:16S rRNA (adenine1518-N6/adenine1519-N6)-dimethyltransferase
VLEHVTPSIAAEILSRHGLRAGMRHGQHYLVDPNTVHKIVRLAGVRDDETILEIGPGIGSLTVALAHAAGRVVAVEIDAAVADALDEVVGDAPNVEVVLGDAMEVDLATIVGGRARLVANLPYNVATPIFMRVLDDFGSITGGLVMVQRELGERWTAQPGSRAYNAVSVRTRFHTEAKIVADVPRTVFMPPPKVASVLVAFDRHDVPPVDVDDERAFVRLVRDAFAHRRKTLRNALIASGHDKTSVEHALDVCAVAERARPQDLSLEAYAQLYATL